MVGFSPWGPIKSWTGLSTHARKSCVIHPLWINQSGEKVLHCVKSPTPDSGNWGCIVDLPLIKVPGWLFNLL